MQRLTGIFLAATIIVLASSCGNVKNLQYVQGAFDTARLSKIQFSEPVIQKGDILGITLYSDDPAATAAVMAQQVLINTEAGKESQTEPPASTSLGFSVNEDGIIQLYKIGIIRAAGMTRRQLADTLAQRYVALDLLKNPYAEVRFLNYKVTLIGEVTRPGTYSIPTDKINIFEAIGLAGDITMFGKRNNVLVVREIDGTRQFAQLDLSKPDIFTSPYYYLKQNDMIIVDVAKNKAAVSDQNTQRAVTMTASVLAAIALIVNIFK